jgi:hypothetical protein
MVSRWIRPNRARSSGEEGKDAGAVIAGANRAGIPGAATPVLEPLDTSRLSLLTVQDGLDVDQDLL